jgi:hypothetical protein
MLLDIKASIFRREMNQEALLLKEKIKQNLKKIRNKEDTFT